MRVNLLHPKKSTKAEEGKEEPKRRLEEDSVSRRDYRSPKRSWIHGAIVKPSGRAYCKVKVLNVILKWHVNQLLRGATQHETDLGQLV